MRALANTMERILNAASAHMQLLPATGGAIEEMTKVDETEREDAAYSIDHLFVDTYLESPTPDWTYKELPLLHRSENHVFRYFLDGSFRYYFLAMGVENERSTPIFLAQTSLSIIKRNDLGKLKRVSGKHKWLLMLSKGRLSDAAWDEIHVEAERAGIPIELHNLSEEDPLTGKVFEGRDLRERARGKTRYLMSKAEYDVVAEFRKELPTGWLIKDGLLSMGSYGGGLSFPEVIAVAKSFTTSQKFTTRDGTSRKKQNIASLLSNLPPHYRTPVFEGYGGNTGFWFLRLRESIQLQFPLFGVIKIEIPNIREQPITTELIDELSSALLAEQYVTPYGSDERWHTHLYPIFQAEQAAKQKFLSNEVIQGSINNALRRMNYGRNNK